MSTPYDKLMSGYYVGIDDDGNVSYGYDQTHGEADPGETCLCDPLTTQQKLQLADEMLARWMRYRADVMRKG